MESSKQVFNKIICYTCTIEIFLYTVVIRNKKTLVSRDTRFVNCPFAPQRRRAKDAIRYKNGRHDDFKFDK